MKKIEQKISDIKEIIERKKEKVNEDILDSLPKADLLNKHLLSSKINRFTTLTMVSFLVSLLITTGIIQIIPYHLFIPLNFGLSLGLGAISSKLVSKYVYKEEKLKEMIKKTDNKSVSEEAARMCLKNAKVNTKKNYYDKLLGTLDDHYNITESLKDKFNISLKNTMNLNKTNEEIKKSKKEYKKYSKLAEELTTKKFLSELNENINAFIRNNGFISFAFSGLFAAFLYTLPIAILFKFRGPFSSLDVIINPLLQFMTVTAATILTNHKILKDNFNAFDKLCDENNVSKDELESPEYYSKELKKTLDSAVDVKVNMEMSKISRDLYLENRNNKDNDFSNKNSKIEEKTNNVVIDDINEKSIGIKKKPQKLSLIMSGNNQNSKDEDKK